MSLHIKGLAHYVPPRILDNRELEGMVETSDEWIMTRTGIRERRIADEDTSEMAAKASVGALRAAGMEASEMEMAVVATCTPDMTMPGAASILQSRLGMNGAPALDLNAACSGFVYAMDVCEGLLSTGRYRNILLSCAERFSSMVNYRDRSTCILFGDAAGSLVLSSEPGGHLMKAAYCGGNGSLAHLLRRPAGGSSAPPQGGPAEDALFVQMDGSEVFKHAVRSMDLAAERTLERAGWKDHEVDWLIPHQANLRLMESLRRRLSLPKEKVVVNIEKYGNTSAASIPLAMSEFQHRFRPGDKLLCVAFGAGFTWGGVAIEW